MAITNNDSYVTPQNVSVSGVYMSFGCTRVLLTKNESDFTLNGICCVFKDASSRNNGFSPLHEFKVSKTITSGELGDNFYTLLYNELKLTYSNSVDV